MEDLIQDLQNKAGLTEEQAIKSVQTIKEHIMSKVPPMMHGFIDNFLGSQFGASNHSATADQAYQQEDIMAKAKKVAEEATEKIEDITEEAKEDVEEFAKEATEKINEWAEKADEAAKEAINKLKDMINEKEPNQDNNKKSV